MKKRYPSIKTLQTAFPGYNANSVRALMLVDEFVQLYWEKNITERYYNEPSMHEKRMICLNHLLDMHGVEYQSKGSNAKSPEFEYLNAGDTYATTLVFINGNFRVTSWGDIVERGNYN